MLDNDSDYLNNIFNLTYGYCAHIQQKIEIHPNIQEATYLAPYSHSPNKPDMKGFAV